MRQVTKAALEQVAARVAVFQKAEAARDKVVYGNKATAEDQEWAARYVDEAHDLVNAVEGLLAQAAVKVPQEVTDEVLKVAFL
jgi:hypothetical protein